MPTGGARIGEQSSARTTILTNDDAHGLIRFSSSSQSVIISEMDGDVLVSLDVERSAGTFGQVRVDWELSGSHTAGEITPTSGQVSLNGSSPDYTPICIVFSGIVSRWSSNGNYFPLGQI